MTFCFMNLNKKNVYSKKASVMSEQLHISIFPRL